MNAGIHKDLSLADYLAADDWVSASHLKRHLPEFFRPFNGSPAADVGSVLHGRFSGDETPVTVVEAATWTGKAAKETREAVTASGGYSILSGDLDTVDGMETALRGHSVARNLLIEAPGMWEVSVFAEVDAVPSRCRFDRLLDDGTAVDIKTTRSGPGLYDLAKAVIGMGYDVGEAHYRAVAAAAGIELEAFYFLFVQNVHPFHVTVVELDAGFLERGQALRDLALNRLLHPEFTAAYPGQNDPITLTLPRWAQL